ncbi:MAG: PPE family protein [Mycobacteriaceae bacterium]|nr:PPE family protein [Mycobacteriaceae bacterium]
MPLGIYAALPPEVNVARLLAGAGAAPMFAASGAYSALAQTLNTLAATMQSQVQTMMNTWSGDAAKTADPAFARYFDWLRTAAVGAQSDSARAGAQGAAYQSAVAAMPTVAEMVANRAAMAALVATNVAGATTAGIAATEANYLRMWTQAAAVMSAYDAETTQNVASAQQSTQAPDIVSKLSGLASAMNGPLSQLVQQIQQAVQEREKAAAPVPKLDLAPLGGITGGLLGLLGTGVGLASGLAGGASNQPVLHPIANPQASGPFVLPAAWSAQGTPASASGLGGPAAVRGIGPVGGMGGFGPLAAMGHGSSLGSASAARPLRDVTAEDRSREVPQYDPDTVVDAADLDADHEHGEACHECGSVRVVV